MASSQAPHTKQGCYNLLHFMSMASKVADFKSLAVCKHQTSRGPYWEVSHIKMHALQAHQWSVEIQLPMEMLVYCFL